MLSVSVNVRVGCSVCAMCWVSAILGVRVGCWVYGVSVSVSVGRSCQRYVLVFGCSVVLCRVLGVRC